MSRDGPSAPSRNEIQSLRDLSPHQWKSAIAAWLGWLFDGLDMHLYVLVAAPFVAELIGICLNLLTNAVIAWNTFYMSAAIDRLRIDGHPVQDPDLAHLSPCRYEHINPYGKYAFEMSKDLGGAKLRPLGPGRPPA